MMPDNITFYITFTSNENILDSIINRDQHSNIALPRSKHWKLFYTRDQKQYFVLELAGCQGVRHRAILDKHKSVEPGFTEKQQIFNVLLTLESLRFAIHSYFDSSADSAVTADVDGDGKYSMWKNNCKHFVLRVVKYFLKEFFTVYNITPLGHALLSLNMHDLNTFRIFGSCPLYIDPKPKNLIEEQEEIEATLPPCAPSTKHPRDTPAELRAAIRMVLPVERRL
ncbi:hypothetical protein BDC45DRAFT_529740 [Circinella umbellata]|nr:hypothetical protein BDC45DRAFT_529740 [Circinella umbellata]